MSTRQVRQQRLGRRDRAPATSASLERRREVERAARARRALDPDAAAHQLRRASPRWSSPRPVPPNRRVVEPSAWLNASKIVRLLVGGDADAGVGDAEVQHECSPSPRVVLAHRHQRRGRAR